MSAGHKKPQFDFLIMKVPRGFFYAVILFTCLATIPPALIIRARSVPREARRIHLIQNMDNQPKYKAQQPNTIFKDERSMRQPVPGTVARSQMIGDTHYFLGTLDGRTRRPSPTTTVDMDLSSVVRSDTGSTACPAMARPGSAMARSTTGRCSS